MIKARQLSYRYDGRDMPVLQKITMEIHEGEHVALIGPNGCGKTTLIKHFNALLAPVEGSVEVDGMDTRDRKSHREIRRRVGMVFQNPDNQIVGVTVEEDVAFGPANLGLPAGEIRERVDEALVLVGLEAFAKRAPHTLSGGEKRLVSIAGVLAMDPRYLALDEPTAYLDPPSRERVLAMIQRLHRRGIAIIHITHDMNDLAGANRLLVMDRGAIVLDGAPPDIFSRVEAMKDLGLHVPQVTLLMRRLRESGLDLKTDILTIDEACAEISSRIGPKGEGSFIGSDSTGGG
jgi:biotin transport system ATP-binding protein/energy-coupling factor transport system ATP-binding protein